MWMAGRTYGASGTFGRKVAKRRRALSLGLFVNLSLGKQAEPPFKPPPSHSTDRLAWIRAVGVIRRHGQWLQADHWPRRYGKITRWWTEAANRPARIPNVRTH